MDTLISLGYMTKALFCTISRLSKYHNLKQNIYPVEIMEFFKNYFF